MTEIVPFRRTVCRLPREILLLIFTSADDSTLAALGGVSLEILETVSPILYRTVKVGSVEQLEKLFCRREDEVMGARRRFDPRFSLKTSFFPHHADTLLSCSPSTFSLEHPLESTVSSTSRRCTTSSSTSPPSRPFPPPSNSSSRGKLPLDPFLSIPSESLSSASTDLSFPSSTLTSSLTSTQSSISSTSSMIDTPTRPSRSGWSTSRTLNFGFDASGSSPRRSVRPPGAISSQTIALPTPFTTMKLPLC
ncbi:hypothetical protein BDY24DRAFT_383920 [Mrakia frigida]|uniref:uncharacterized protein n=1 Tax=Mrakia frigida TaxID=29902 RepID=UPI003FCBFC39